MDNWMTRTARPLEIFLGLLFLLAAGLKAMDAQLFAAQIYQYGVLSSPLELRLTAVSVLFVETFLGIAMVVGLRLRGLVLIASLALIALFTVLVAYAWPSDCGCFGRVKMGPVATIVKNVIMGAMGLVALAGLRRRGQLSDAAALPKVLVAVGAAIALTAYAFPQVFTDTPAPATPPAQPAPPQPVAAPGEEAPQTAPAPADPAAPPVATAPVGAGRAYAGILVEDPVTGEQFDLAEGTYLVASLSMTCEHCMATVPTLNDLYLNPDLPSLVALAYEPEPGSLEDFSAQTSPMFPMYPLGNDFIRFTQYIGSEPPRLALIQDGRELAHWDGDPPALDEILQAMPQ